MISTITVIWLSLSSLGSEIGNGFCQTHSWKVVASCPFQSTQPMDCVSGEPQVQLISGAIETPEDCRKRKESCPHPKLSYTGTGVIKDDKMKWNIRWNKEGFSVLASWDKNKAFFEGRSHPEDLSLGWLRPARVIDQSLKGGILANGRYYLILCVAKYAEEISAFELTLDEIKRATRF